MSKPTLITQAAGEVWPLIEEYADAKHAQQSGLDWSTGSKEDRRAQKTRDQRYDKARAALLAALKEAT